MFLKNRNIISKIIRSKVTDYAALIKDKLIDLIEITFNREGSPYLGCNDRNECFTLEKPKNIIHGLVKMYVMR